MNKEAVLYRDFLSAHEELEPLLAEAWSSATKLLLDPSTPWSSECATRAWRFVELSIPHMDHEEDQVFPQALARGVSRELIDALVTDHETLRAMARRLADLGMDGTEAPGAEAIALLNEFVRSFSTHGAREEALLGAGLCAQKARSPAP